MKKYFQLYSLLFLSLTLGLISCKKDLLDLKPLDSVTEVDVWNDPKLVLSFVNRRYDQVGWGWSESWMSSVADETYLTWSRGCEPITQGYVNPNDLGRMNGAWWGGDNRSWSTIWANIKDCNVFFTNIDKVPFADEALKKRYTGEVTFIRALMYHDLVSKWGGMPLITQVYDLTNLEAGATLPRNTYKECVDFIVSECDKAAALLPPAYTGADKGRATSVAALALKSRVLLYAASPLMNKANVNPLVGYPSPESSRWQKAADAAKAAIDLAVANGYALYNKYGDDVKTNYIQLFLDKANPEVIFSRQNYGSPNNIQYLDQSNGPNGSDQWGGNTPIQEFVDAFEMADGSKFSWSNPAHAARPFANRDKRLYATVLSDGDPWKGRIINAHFDEQADGSLKGGSDTKDGAIGSWNASKTAYNVRKFLNEAYVVNSWTFTGASAQNWIWFRLGEIYLNYAEALYNLNNETGAKAALNNIRRRARMPEVTASGTALWEAIANERRVELAFEEHRYFDARRWMIADNVLNRPATGILIIKKKDGTMHYNAHTGDSKTLVENRKFVPNKMEWLPVPQSEIDKNPNLKQNPGY
ncbi:RagB/SusD family nutrient uptake outer membrane protein [Paraflavisolibacter sp. H34]|uniref:RagB/SusD family nutrient uptake outer membrane protein n=1 Tax=Huijunlia imazamoxiresistens TaxID=3127457 RepID=UPI0030168CC1